MTPWRRWLRNRFFIAGDRLCARRRTFAVGNWLAEVGWRLSTDRQGRPL